MSDWGGARPVAGRKRLTLERLLDEGNFSWDNARHRRLLDNESETTRMGIKICVRCEKPKPASAFRAIPAMRDGLNSWCRECCTNATRDWRAKNPGYTSADKILKRGKYADPVAYSKHVCEHVSEVVSSAIRRFEDRTGKEAPPQLSAILSLATSLADQQEPTDDRPTTQRVCHECGNIFESHTDNLRSCRPCKARKVSEKNRRRNDTLRAVLVGNGPIKVHPDTNVRYDTRSGRFLLAREYQCVACGEPFEGSSVFVRETGIRCEACAKAKR